MPATNVTGVGLGNSFGEFKPENSYGCCRGKLPETEPTTPARKECCAVKLKVSNNSRYKVVTTNGKFKACP